MHRSRRSGPTCPNCRTNRWKTKLKALRIFQCRFCSLVIHEQGGGIAPINFVKQ